MANKRFVLDSEEFDIKPNLEFKILNVDKVYNKKFKKFEIFTEIQINHNLSGFLSLATVRDDLEENFKEILDKSLEDTSPEDRVAVLIESENLDNQIWVSYRKKKDFNIECINNAIEKVAQSQRSFLTDGKITMIVKVLKNISGRGSSKKSKNPPQTYEEKNYKKRSVIKIKNNDNSCGYRAVYVAKYYIDHQLDISKNEWKKVSDSRYAIQKSGAEIIAQSAGLSMDIPVDEDGWLKIQESLEDYQIKVIDGTYPSNIIFQGQVQKEKIIYIECLDDHYNSIINIRGYIGKNYFCESCHKGFCHLYDHCCPEHCKKCFSSCSSNNNNFKIQCIECNRDFKSDKCYQMHIQKQLCKYIKKCVECHVEYNVRNKHTCNKSVCSKCHQLYKEQPHYCFIKPKDAAKLEEDDKVNKIIVAYDIESTIINSQHQPNLLAQQTKCDKCTEVGCEFCQIGEPDYYFGKNCIIRFIDYIFDKLAKKAKLSGSLVYVFAHNARGYDAQFLLRELWNRNYIDVNVIMRGRKILLIECGNVKLLDSLNFFLQALDKLPKALGLDVTLKKGAFPHSFNRVNNYNYVGPMPSIEYFEVNKLKPDKAREIEKWYQSQVSRQDWNFMKELIEYCQNDVDILLKCLLKFRKTFIEITSIDPLTRNFTLASVGMEVFKAKFLKPLELAVTPVNGYTNNRNYSLAAETWLDWIQKSRNITLKREFKIGPYYADGYEEKSRTVFEFFGCYWHGCPCQHSSSRDNNNIGVVQQFSANQKYSEVKEKIDYYVGKGYKLEYVWECEFKEFKKNNSLIANYLTKRYQYYKCVEKVGPIKIRDSFFGGRTNNIQFYKSVESDEEIKYLDFCSLYPFVLKSKSYPNGHPILINEDFDFSLVNYYGFVKCKVEAPRGLYLPVLPVNMDGKLIFPLCKICAYNKYYDSCECLERAFVGTWTTEELKLVIEKGYKIIKIYQVLHYETRTSDIFSKYINMWLKIKQEASGWPAWCQTELDREKYIQDYKQHEGIELDANKIEKNEALRYIAKIMLNSFWGKMAQRPNLPQTEIVKTIARYHELADDDRIEITGEFSPNDDTTIITWEWTDEEDARVTNYNIAVSSYVTAYARIELYKLMEEIEYIRPHSLLYHDTDSVIYYRKMSDREISCGDFLGQLTDEIQKNYGDGSKCNAFVSLGPKNYAYQVLNQNGGLSTEIKSKGITLTGEALEIINFKRLVNMAIKYSINRESIKLEIPQCQFVINKHTQIITRVFNKIFQAVSDKRVIQCNITLPYGF